MTRIDQAQLKNAITEWQNETIVVKRHRSPLNAFERSFIVTLKSWMDADRELSFDQARMLVKEIAKEKMSSHKLWTDIIDWREEEEWGLTIKLTFHAPTQGLNDVFLTLEKKEVSHV